MHFVVCIFIIKNFKNKSFIYFWLSWVFVAVYGLSLVVVSGGYSLVAVGRLLIAGASLAAEKAMATHSSTLAWKIPWTEEPGRLQSMGSRRVGHD